MIFLTILYYKLTFLIMKSFVFIVCVIAALMSLSSYARSESPFDLFVIFLSCVGLILNFKFGSEMPEHETE